MAKAEGSPNRVQLVRGVEGPRPIEVERTAENEHFFIDHPRRGTELIYQGSALIASLLELHQFVENIDSENENIKPPKRHLAFFDKRGVFYGPVALNGLYRNVNANGSSTVKHTAIFEPTEGHSEAFAIPIDDIYCLSLVKDTEEIT